MPAQSRPLPSGPLRGVPGAAPGPGVSAVPMASGNTRLEEWFREHFDVLWRMAVRLGVPRGNVDDVVQEAFITAERRASDIVAGSERRFLIATVVKLSANVRRRAHFQRESLRQLVDAGDHPPDAEQLLERKQLRELVDVALDELPLEQRAVLLLYEIEDLTVPEIAELLELPVGTVASRLARARSKFSRAAARLQAKWKSERRVTG
jgi:RNA polymerase sigma-70 factor, ECF subfamily